MVKFYPTALRAVVQRTGLLAVVLFAFAAGALAQPGAIDAGFNASDLGFGSGDGTNGSPLTCAVLPNGKLLIGGAFNNYNDASRNFVAVINNDGTPDAGFNPGAGATSTVWATASQPDGKVLIGGDFTTFNGTTRNRLARVSADGTLDATFNPGAGAGSQVRRIVVQPDGKVLICGSFSTYGGVARNKIARVAGDGSLDATFNPGTGPNSTNTISAMALQPDGKIIIVGTFTSYNGNNCNRVARLNADGSFDATFNVGTGANNSVSAVALQADGKVLVGGSFTSFNGTLLNRIARLTTTGAIDGTFVIGTGANNLVNAIAVQPDGKVLITGGSLTAYNGTTRNGIARINSNGSVDATFDPGAGGVNINDFVLQADGKILIVGAFTTFNNVGRNYVAQINGNGTLDAAFNPATGASGTVSALAVQTDGKVLLGGGFAAYNGTSRNRIARVAADGTPDATFNPGTGANNIVSSIVIQPDGKILISGNFTLYNGTACNRIARLNSDGSFDATFNPGTGFNGSIGGIALQPDGKVLIAGGFTTFNGIGRNRIARLASDGSLDATFDPATGPDAAVTVISLQPDGKILIGGNFTTVNGIARSFIARLAGDGSLDATFNPGTGANGTVNVIVLQPDGKVLISGAFTSYNGIARNRIARLAGDGSLDATFDPGTGTDNAVSSIALQPDGKVLLAGDFTTYGGTPLKRIVRINSNGSLDVTFNPGTGANNVISAIALQSDGNLLIGGTFTSYNGTGRNRVARILGTGTGTPLPLTFHSLQAYPQGHDVAVEWRTENERGMLRYEIEHAADGRSFAKAAEQPAGNEPGAAGYRWLHESAGAGTHYYRIRIVHSDGSIGYSPTVKVFSGGVQVGQGSIAIYPNPLQGTSFGLLLNSQPAGNYSLRLIDAAGRLVWSGQLVHGGGSAAVRVSGPDALQRGLYLLEVGSPDGRRMVQKVSY